VVEATTEAGVAARSRTEGAAPLFEEFFRAEYRSVMRALVLVAGDEATAEDLAQEAFARAFERWTRVGAMDSQSGYVYRTALNLNRSRLRRAAMALRHRARDVGSTGGGEDHSVRQEVLEMLRSLPKTQREALMLVDWLGYSAKGAARILRIRPASVRGRLHRARLTLQNTFGGDHE
jgi:RNA polymerase sigma-70 factor (ECF subfamily)